MSEHKFTVYHGKSVDGEHLTRLMEENVDEIYFTDEASFKETYPDAPVIKSEITIICKTTNQAD